MTGRFRRRRRETAGLAWPHPKDRVARPAGRRGPRPIDALIDFDRVRASRKSGRGFFTYSKR
jgi:hypothetical protein